MMGRPPKPTAIHLLNGNPGKRPLNTSEPSFPAEDTSPPAFLTSAAKREWRRLLPTLLRQGLFTVADVAEFTGYCLAWAEVGELARFIRKNGRTYDKMYNGVVEQVKPRPEVAMLDRALARLHLFGASFGLSPSARTRLTMPEAKRDTLDDLLG